MGRTFKHLNFEKRLIIKDMLNADKSVSDIAKAIGVCYQTIYYELQKNSYEGSYDPHYAQQQYEKNLKNKGRTEILSDRDLAKYISDLILIQHLSPERIVEKLAENDRGFSDVPKSSHTIYSAIDKGLLPNVTRESLLSRSSTVFCGGQICIPKWVLDKLSINDGDVLLLEITDDNEIVYKKAKNNQQCLMDYN